MTLLTIAEIQSEWGSYFRKGGQGVKDIIGVFFQPSVTHKYFGPMPTDQTQERRTKFTKNRVLQRFQQAFTPVGGGTFVPCPIDLAQMKVDEEGYIEDLQKSWLGFLANVDTNDRKAWPFVRWYVETIIKQSNSDYELNEVWLGEAEAITPGTATAAGGSMDGLAKQIADGITAGDITPITSPGTWSTDELEFVDQIEQWILDVKSASDEHRLMVENELDYLFMNMTLRDRYSRGLRKKYNQNFDQTGLALAGVKPELPIADQNIKVVGLPSMGSSSRIFMSPKENRAAFDKNPQSATVLQIENVDRKLKLYGDIWKGIGFWYKGYVIPNAMSKKKDEI